MAPSSSKLLFLLLLVFLTACVVNAQPPLATPRPMLSPRRLKLEELPCWDSLFQLQSCTGEIIQFFYNGQANLGPLCCQSLQVIERNCWPAILASLGLTPEETALLQGYCRAKDDTSPTPETPQLAD